MNSQRHGSVTFSHTLAKKPSTISAWVNPIEHVSDLTEQQCDAVRRLLKRFEAEDLECVILGNSGQLSSPSP